MNLLRTMMKIQIIHQNPLLNFRLQKAQQIIRQINQKDEKVINIATQVL